jgi:saccharopine dehydrogenase (NAD+, L-lysine-forming)
MNIYIRAETYSKECRSPLVPDDVAILVRQGYHIAIERSSTRCFTDDEFEQAGAELTGAKWFDQEPSTLILGLKELDHLDLLNGHSHVYFSHCLKNQMGSSTILESFHRSHSKLYDLEYFRKDGRRCLGFGFYAGLVGAVLGLRQHYNKKMYNEDISDLQPWTSMDEMYEYVKVSPVYVAVIGNGRSSKGVQHILQTFGVVFDIIERDQTVVPYIYDILINCITLDEAYDKVWLSPEYMHKKSLLVVDISCDYTKKNTPITIYKEATTWKNPVVYSNNVSVIAIDNLPSLLPRESSSDFSKKLAELLQQYGDSSWDNCLSFSTTNTSIA